MLIQSPYLYTAKRKLFARNLFVCILLLLFFSCESPLSSDTGVVSAKWDESEQALYISGEAAPQDKTVQIHDAANGALLGKAIVDPNGRWSATTTVAACKLHIELGGNMTTVSVASAPENCVSAGGAALRARNDSTDDLLAGVSVLANPQPLANIPNAVIIEPPQDLSITTGDTVMFSGTVIGSAITPPFSFYWDMGGAAPNATVQNPGSLRFDRAGVYMIKLSVSDALGVPDPTPAVRMITVSEPNNPLAITPTPQILSPQAIGGRVDIQLGESLFFAGTATDDLGSTSFTFEWDFSGIVDTRFGAIAGDIIFSRAGSYVVSLYATSQAGLRSPVPATVTVNVAQNNSANQAPDGAITSPMNDITIGTGESIQFDAIGIDPDNNNPLYYSWEFDGVRPDIYMSPISATGPVTFDIPGRYSIEMTVTDSLGLKDPNASRRVITVVGAATNPPPVNGVLATTILAPQTDVTIRPGESVFFSGQATSASNPGPFLYYWNFGGAAADSNLATPGNITFPFPGQFFVNFYATDQFGNVVGSPSARTITVADPASVRANILSPMDNTQLSVGSPIFLMGDAGNTLTVNNLSYEWRVHQIRSDRDVFTSNQQSPGQFVFTEAGSYHVHLRVSGTDVASGQQVSDRATVRVEVTSTLGLPPGGGVNPIATNSGIVAPASDMVIYVGNQVAFEAIDIPGANLNYNWDFSGQRRSSSRRAPSPVSFDTPGTFFISLQVTGTANGLPVNIFDQRTITVLQQNPAFPPSPTFPPTPTLPTNPVANGTGIVSPATDMLINIGDTVRFEANRISGANINYAWSFGTAAPPSASRRPDPIVFNTPGTFFVTLTMTGTLNGVPINSFDQRVITVLQASLPTPPVFPPVSPPIGTPGVAGGGILAPAGDVVINVGGSVDFEANRISGTNISYRWDFGNVAPPSTRRNPGPLQFNTPGTFFVSLQVTGSINGAPVNIYDQRVVTVQQGFQPPIGAAPQPPIGTPFPSPPATGAAMPEGYIVEPASSYISVRAGQAVAFSGVGFDPTGVGPLTFQWSFGGAARNIETQNPGTISFNRVGTFVVTLLVRNAAGQFDLTPPTVVVQVTP